MRREEGFSFINTAWLNKYFIIKEKRGSLCDIFYRVIQTYTTYPLFLFMAGCTQIQTYTTYSPIHIYYRVYPDTEVFYNIFLYIYYRYRHILYILIFIFITACTLIQTYTTCTLFVFIAGCTQIQSYTTYTLFIFIPGCTRIQTYSTYSSIHIYYRVDPDTEVFLINSYVHTYYRVYPGTDIFYIFFYSFLLQGGPWYWSILNIFSTDIYYRVRSVELQELRTREFVEEFQPVKLSGLIYFMY